MFRALARTSVAIFLQESERQHCGSRFMIPKDFHKTRCSVAANSIGERGNFYQLEVIKKWLL
jgi:hypothetical protein